MNNITLWAAAFRCNNHIMLSGTSALMTACLMVQPLPRATLCCSNSNPSLILILCTSIHPVDMERSLQCGRLLENSLRNSFLSFFFFICFSNLKQIKCFNAGFVSCFIRVEVSVQVAKPRGQRVRGGLGDGQPLSSPSSTYLPTKSSPAVCSSCKENPVINPTRKWHVGRVLSDVKLGIRFPSLRHLCHTSLNPSSRV